MSPSSAKWIFVGLSLILTLVGTIWVYPGVRKLSSTRKDGLLAAFMGSALTGVFVALVLSTLWHGILVLWQSP